MSLYSFRDLLTKIHYICDYLRGSGVARFSYQYDVSFILESVMCTHGVQYHIDLRVGCAGDASDTSHSTKYAHVCELLWEILVRNIVETVFRQSLLLSFLLHIEHGLYLVDPEFIFESWVG